MVHLSSPMSIGVMVFYSFLTFFLGPLIPSFMGDHPHRFTVFFWFIVSIFLWMKF